MRGRRVLVAYATDGGGTARVAQAIGRAVQAHATDVDVSAVRFVRGLSRYDAVIVGSPHRRDAWHPDAAAFLRKHRKALGSRPVWLFHVGSLLTEEATRLPPDVMRDARHIGVVGVLNLMTGDADHAPDATMTDAITNVDAIEPLATLVVKTIDRRRAS